MSFTIRALEPGDEAILAHIAVHDAEFDLDGRGEPLAPLAPDAARRFLANPAVQFWVAHDGDTLVGYLYGLVVPLRSGDGEELLIYEVAAHTGHRRRGVGRALYRHMTGWMNEKGIREVWVLADNPTAVAYYQGCGMAVEADQPTYMTAEATGS